MAYRLGDPTACLNHRDGFHPLVQLDFVGLVFFATSGIGWGKILPMKPQNFKKPLRDSLLVLMGGTASCFFFAVVCLGIAGLLYPLSFLYVEYVLWFVLYMAVLAFSYGLFQWLPFPFFGLYQVAMLHVEEKKRIFCENYQGYVVIFLLVLLWAGYLPSMLAFILKIIIKPFCVFVPFSFVEYYFL